MICISLISEYIPVLTPAFRRLVRASLGRGRIGLEGLVVASYVFRTGKHLPGVSPWTPSETNREAKSWGGQRADPVRSPPVFTIKGSISSHHSGSVEAATAGSM